MKNMNIYRLEMEEETTLNTLFKIWKNTNILCQIQFSESIHLLSH